MGGRRERRPPERSSSDPSRKIVDSSNHVDTSWILMGRFSELMA